MQSGMSLVVVLVALALLGGIALIFNSVIDGAVQRVALLQDSNDKAALRSWLNNNIDCGATQTATPTCNAGSRIELIARSGQPLVNATGSDTTIGKWKVRANCSSTGALTIEVHRINWSASKPWETLFKNVPFSCVY